MPGKSPQREIATSQISVPPSKDGMLNGRQSQKMASSPKTVSYRCLQF